MSSIVISGDTSGAITVAAPAVSGTNTATLPAATGTIMVSGNMPAFSAYASTSQTISINTWTKTVFDVEEFDTNNNFASSRFTPTVAGYYQINSCVSFNGSGPIFITIYKNGANFKSGIGINSAANIYGAIVTGLVYLNGSTDYVEIYSYSALSTLGSGQSTTFFQGCLVRTA